MKQLILAAFVAIALAACSDKAVDDGAPAQAPITTTEGDATKPMSCEELAKSDAVHGAKVESTAKALEKNENDTTMKAFVDAANQHEEIKEQLAKQKCSKS